MALIIVTGYPSSGKTYRARQLGASLAERISSSPVTNQSRKSHLNVIHIPSHHASIGPATPSPTDNPRDTIYNSSATEKTARANELGAVKRALSKDAIVIADSLNYIKGYRYQLWCEAKAAGVRCLTVHTAVPEEDCKEWNREKIRQWKWEGETNIEHKTQDGALGSLKPQSHTALYGDKSTRNAIGSADLYAYMERIRSSEPPEQSLRSLYLHDRTADPESSPRGSAQQPPSSQQTSTYPPTSSPVHVSYPTEAPYSPSTLAALLMRYEPPSPFSRWDTPLFPILSSDPTPQIDDIWNAIFPSSSASALSSSGLNRSIPEKVIPHAATVVPKATASEALQLIERRTNTVLSAVTFWAKDHGDEGGEVLIPVESGKKEVKEKEEEEQNLKLRVPYGVNVNMAAGQRLRRRYVQMQRGGIAHGQGTVGLGKGEVEAGFVRWLEGEWGVDGA